MIPKLENAIFPVDERQIYWYESPEDKGKQNTTEDFKAVIRADTQELISVLPLSSTIKHNKEVLEKTVGVVEKLGYTPIIDPVNSYLDNAKMVFNILLKEVYLNDGESPVNLSFIIRNSYDNTYAYYFVMGTFRAMCLNGAVIGFEPIANSIYSKKHNRRASITNAEETIKKTIDLFPHLERRIQVVKEISFNNNKEIMQKSLLESKKIFKSNGTAFIKHLQHNIGLENLNTLYDFYKELTWWASHKVPSLQKENIFQKIAGAFKI